VEGKDCKCERRFIESLRKKRKKLLQEEEEKVIQVRANQTLWHSAATVPYHCSTGDSVISLFEKGATFNCNNYMIDSVSAAHDAAP
jgi:hypothetical protein